jgi:hypothetical protein
VNSAPPTSPLEPGSLHGPTFAAAVRTFRTGAQVGSDLLPVIILVVILLLPGKDGFEIGRFLGAVGALFFRDLCRWGGIHLLGYPDKQLLIFPFLRTRLPAGTDRVERYKQGIVILLGPLPSLFLAFVITMATISLQTPTLRNTLVYVAAVNAFLLVPLGTFDGGRILNLVIFSRSRIVELLFLGVTSVALFYIGIRLGQVAFYLIGGLGLLNAGRRFGTRRAATAVHARFPDLPVRPQDIEDPAAAELFEAAHKLAPAAARRATDAGDPRHAALYATRMREIHEAAVLAPPSLLWSILLLFLYGLGIVLATATLAITILGPKLHL